MDFRKYTIADLGLQIAEYNLFLILIIFAKANPNSEIPNPNSFGSNTPVLQAPSLR